MTRCPSTFLYRPLVAAMSQNSLQCKHDAGHVGAHAAYVSPTLGDVVWTTPAAAKNSALDPSTDDLREQITAALNAVQSLIRVAPDGRVEYRLTVAVDAVLEVVAPLLAARDAEVSRLASALADLELAAGEAGHGWQVAQEECQRLSAEVAGLKAAIADIDAHATPIGLLNNDDPEGSPHHYAVTVGALHRALGKAHTAEPCERERTRLQTRVVHLEDECRALCDYMDRIRYAAGVDPETYVDDLIEAVAERVRGRHEAQDALLALCANGAELIRKLSEELAWQKDAYRDSTDKVATGRIIGMEDALRSVRETLGAPVIERPAIQEAVQEAPDGDDLHCRACGRPFDENIRGVLTDQPVAVQETPTPPASRWERCPNCNGDGANNWFDREICPEPCGTMHTRCKGCGHALDGCRLAIGNAVGEPPAPRVWRTGDPEPVDRPAMRDRHGSVWTPLGPDSAYWSSRFVAPFTWETVVAKWGPLTEVLEGGGADVD